MPEPPDVTRPPWTAKQVIALNDWQALGWVHPFTCPENHGTEEARTLVAKPDGWHCPTCAYTQDWAHAFMTGLAFDGLYILDDDRKPRRVESFVEWTDWRVKHPDVQVASEQIGKARVSTVFLGVDQSFMRRRKPPLVFETMIFGGAHNGHKQLTGTWDDALAAHKAAVELARGEKP